MSDLHNEIDKPHTWSYQSASDEAVEVEVTINSTEYRTVRSFLKGESLINLKKIVRIQNPYLYGRYLIRKEEYLRQSRIFSERTLLHATAAHKIPLIITNNLDWRFANRVKFGKGVSFSNCAVYANKECSRANGKDRAMIIAKVLIGNSTCGNCDTILPSGKNDTTTDQRGKVFVKYYDDEFYPEYVAYYTNTLPTIKQYNRFDMYDSDMYDFDMFDLYDL